jgi:PKD repeat protein
MINLKRKTMKELTRRILIAAALFFISAASSHAAVSVAINTNTQYQTIRSWGCTIPKGRWYLDAPDRLFQQLIDIGVNDMGVTCIRFEPPSGGYAGDRSWEWDNDDTDPLHINWAALNTASLDAMATKWVVPVKQAVEARGDSFYMQISQSFYQDAETGSAPAWLLRSPGEYAEYAASILLRLRDEHGVPASSYTICNEASYKNAFDYNITVQMAKAVGRRMAELGFNTGIQFPESMSITTASTWLQDSKDDAELWKYVNVISYHLYGGFSDRTNVSAFAKTKGIMTAQTEFMANNDQADDYLYDDMTLGEVSDWEVFEQGFPIPYVYRTSFDRKMHFWLFRQFMPYVRPGAVRVDAVSADAMIRPLAFTKNGATTVLLLNTSVGAVSQTVTLNGLLPGEYGISRSINETLPQELGVQTVGTNGQLTVTMAVNAVLTVYPHNSGNQAPTVLTWTSSDAYLKTGVSSSTTLSVEAMDSELDPLAYQWSVVQQPAGASAVLASPTNKSCAASGLTAAGEYVFAVTVSDATHSKTREVLLNVHTGNQPPVIGNVHVRNPARVILPASATLLRCDAVKDIEGSAITYLWTVVSQPAGASAVLAAPTSSACDVSGLTVAGNYTFHVEVSDGTDTTGQDISFPVEPQDMNSPVISNLTNSVLPSGAGRLSASTSDADGDWISHWWEQIGGPTNGRAYFSNQGSTNTDVFADTAGTYQFRLIAVSRNTYKNSSAVTLTLEATTAPAAGFTASPVSGAAPLTVTFTDTSTGGITDRFWNFGDGITTNTTATSLSHIYAAAGTNSVQLIVSGPAGASTNTQIITVTPPVPPSAGFTASPVSGLIPLTVTFTDTSTGSITNRFWNFGDGATTGTTATSVSHTYTVAATSTVQLIVSGPAGVSTNTQIDCIKISSGTLITAHASDQQWDSAGNANGLGQAAGRIGSGAATSTGSVNIITVTNFNFDTAGTTSAAREKWSANISTDVSAGNGILGLRAGTAVGDTGTTVLTMDSTTTADYKLYYRGSDIALPAGAAGWDKLEIRLRQIGAGGVPVDFVNTGTIFDGVTGGLMSIATLPVASGTSGGNPVTVTKDAVSKWMVVTYDLISELTTAKFKQNFRIDPAQTTNGTFEIDYIKLTAVGPDISTTDRTTGMVLPFWIPDLGGLQVVGAEFAMNVVSGGLSSATGLANADVYGVRSGDSSTTTSNDYSGGTLLANNWFNISSNLPLGEKTFNQSNLTAWIVGQVGTTGGKYVFITVRPDAIDGVSRYATVNTADAASGKPRLTLAILGATEPVSDADGDGIPDAWELQHFGSTNANPSALAANGVNTIYETYIAGLNPTNAQSAFVISGGPLLRWDAVSGRVYSVYWTTNLMNGFQPLETNIVWPQNSWTGQVSGAPGEFYKIKVQLAP